MPGAPGEAAGLRGPGALSPAGGPRLAEVPGCCVLGFGPEQPQGVGAGTLVAPRAAPEALAWHGAPGKGAEVSCSG